MTEQKILNWMIRGPTELADVYRSIEPNLLIESFSKKYKGILRTVVDYHSKYKTPPTEDILYRILPESERQYISDLNEDPCVQNEIQYFVDQL